MKTKFNKSKIFKNAWKYKKIYNCTFSNALKYSWNMEKKLNNKKPKLVDVFNSFKIIEKTIIKTKNEMGEMNLSSDKMSEYYDLNCYKGD